MSGSGGPQLRAWWHVGTASSEERHCTISLLDPRVVGVHTKLLDNRFPENQQVAIREDVSFTYDWIVWT